MRRNETGGRTGASSADKRPKLTEQPVYSSTLFETESLAVSATIKTIKNTPIPESTSLAKIIDSRDFSFLVAISDK